MRQLMSVAIRVNAEFASGAHIVEPSGRTHPCCQLAAEAGTFTGTGSTARYRACVRTGKLNSRTTSFQPFAGESRKCPGTILKHAPNCKIS